MTWIRIRVDRYVNVPVIIAIFPYCLDTRDGKKNELFGWMQIWVHYVTVT